MLSHSDALPIFALVTQSQSVMGAVLDWADDIRLGFSTAISLGDEAVIDAAEVLDFLALDRDTDSIVLYLESTTSSRRFSSALRAAAGVKPVVVLKDRKRTRLNSSH